MLGRCGLDSWFESYFCVWVRIGTGEINKLLWHVLKPFVILAGPSNDGKVTIFCVRLNVKQKRLDEQDIFTPGVDRDKNN